MAELKSISELLQDSIYRWLCRDFQGIEDGLTPEMKTELDGLLWKLAGTLTNAGLWETLRSNFQYEAELAREGVAHERTV